MLLSPPVVLLCGVFAPYRELLATSFVEVKSRDTGEAEDLLVMAPLPSRV